MEFAGEGLDDGVRAALSQHRLLVLHDAPATTLFFTGRPADPDALAASLDEFVRVATDGWRMLADYQQRDVAASLRVGFGKLLTAPAPVCAVVAAALEAARISASMIESSSTNPPCRALILGRSYVIAEAFAFERRD